VFRNSIPPYLHGKNKNVEMGALLSSKTSGTTYHTSPSHNNESCCSLLEVTPCSLVEGSQRFGGTYCLYLQGLRINQANSSKNLPAWEYSSALKMEIQVAPKRR
jgi:hypothetical protein